MDRFAWSFSRLLCASMAPFGPAASYAIPKNDKY